MSWIKEPSCWKNSRTGFIVTKINIFHPRSVEYHVHRSEQDRLKGNILTVMYDIKSAKLMADKLFKEDKGYD